MSAKIINGKVVAKQLRDKFRQKINHLLNTKGIKPGLAVILVGEDPASKIYVQNKISSCKDVGINSFLHQLPHDTTEDQLLSTIDSLNLNKNVHGILVQLPLPPHLNEEKILATIHHNKDVDGFGNYHTGSLSRGNPSIIPCTPAGIMELLDFYKINVSGKNAVIIGRSNIVGKPLGMLLLKAGATITICHSKTKDLAHHTKHADIVAVAIGKPKFLKADMIKPRAIIIDVGINRDQDGKICGDVDFQDVIEKAAWVTPVPGGIGPMTITMLLNNTINAATLP